MKFVAQGNNNAKVEIRNTDHVTTLIKLSTLCIESLYNAHSKLSFLQEILLVVDNTFMSPYFQVSLLCAVCSAALCTVKYMLKNNYVL